MTGKKKHSVTVRIYTVYVASKSDWTHRYFCGLKDKKERGLIKVQVNL